MLKSTYGSLIIKKDTILYHLTDEEFTYKPEKKLLFTKTLRLKTHIKLYSNLLQKK